MDSSEVITLVQLFEDNDIEFYIDGGWCVDALLGRQTRYHNDLDIALPHTFVPLLRQLMTKRGYREILRDDSRECNFVLADDKGNQLDVHSYIFDAQDTCSWGVAYKVEQLTGKGLIDNHPVNCISPEWIVKFHTGYTLDENDYHDVKLICEHFGFELPEEYKEFTENENIQ